MTFTNTIRKRAECSIFIAHHDFLLYGNAPGAGFEPAIPIVSYGTNAVPAFSPPRNILPVFPGCHPIFRARISPPIGNWTLQAAGFEPARCSDSSINTVPRSETRYFMASTNSATLALPVFPGCIWEGQDSNLHDLGARLIRLSYCALGIPTLSGLPWHYIPAVLPFAPPSQIPEEFRASGVLP